MSLAGKVEDVRDEEAHVSVESAVSDFGPCKSIAVFTPCVYGSCFYRTRYRWYRPPTLRQILSPQLQVAALLFSTFIQRPILQGDAILTSECVKVGSVSGACPVLTRCRDAAGGSALLCLFWFSRSFPRRYQARHGRWLTALYINGVA